MSESRPSFTPDCRCWCQVRPVACTLDCCGCVVHDPGTAPLGGTQPRTLLEALGIQPGSDEDEKRRSKLAADFERIREAERAAHIAAAGVWLDG